MELMPKPNPTFSATLFIALLLAAPCFSSGVTESENIYEIDYRGPETHSQYRPSPGRSSHFHGHASSSSECKGLRGGNGGVTATTIGPQNAREVHG